MVSSSKLWSSKTLALCNAARGHRLKINRGGFWGMCGFDNKSGIDVINCSSEIVGLEMARASAGYTRQYDPKKREKVWISGMLVLV
jgi:hypothetical protein